jgi:enoyl-CoA hydratase
MSAITDQPVADADPVLVEERGQVLVVTLNRPEARNAVNRALAEAVAEAMDRLDDRDDLRVGILTGAGGNFCAGMDLKAFLRGEAPAGRDRGFAGLTGKPPRKTLIAAVEGPAVAGGFEIVLACDLVVASTAATFGLPEVKRGLAAGGGGLVNLHRRLPYHVAMEVCLTGDPIRAEEAHRHGLVNELTDPGRALDAAMALAERIVANAPLAVDASKRVVVESVDWPTDEAMNRQVPIIGEVFVSEDAREGARAFAEKRAPVWQGR